MVDRAIEMPGSRNDSGDTGWQSHAAADCWSKPDNKADAKSHPISHKDVVRGESYCAKDGEYVVAEAFSHVTAKGGAGAFPLGASVFVDAKLGSQVVALTGSYVTAEHDSHVDAGLGSFVDAQANSTVHAMFGSQVEARPRSFVLAESGSLVMEYPGANVLAKPGATVVKLHF